jgi:hypothetical protein
MGIYKRAIYSVNDCSTDEAFIEIYDVAVAQAGPPGFDNVLGSPYKTANPDGSGLGVRHRPGTVVSVKAKSYWTSDEDQNQTNVGNNPGTRLSLTFYTWDLKKRGLLVNGVCKIKPNDRLLRLVHWKGDVEKFPDWAEGEVRADFTRDPRRALFCSQVQHAPPGGHVLKAFFENRPTEM